MRNWGYIGDASDFESCVIQSPHRGLTTRTRSFYANLQVLHPKLLDNLAYSRRGHLRREWRTLSRTSKSATTCRSPCKCISLAIRDGDNGVVKGRVHMRHAIGHRSLNLFLSPYFALNHNALTSSGSPKGTSLLTNRSTRTFSGTCIRIRPLAPHWKPSTVTNTSITP